MIVGIHKNTKGKLIPFSLGYIKVLDYNKIPHVLMDVEEDAFRDKLNDVDAFVFQVGHTSDMLQLSSSFMPVVQLWQNIKVFPNFYTLWSFDDKIKQHYLNMFLDLGFAPSWVFWTKKKAFTWLSNADYPVIIKLKGGAGSTNVVKVDSCHEGKKIVNKLFSQGVADSSLTNTWKVKYFPIKRFIRSKLIQVKRFLINEDITSYWQINKNYAYFQKYLPGNEYDTRVTVIGGRAFAFRRFNRKNDFRASGSGNISYDMAAIDLRMVKIALAASNKLEFQCMAYDFLYDAESPVICEISYSFNDEAVFNCPGFWDEKLEWHEGHFMPQYFILKDLLNVDIEHPPVD